MARGRVVVAKPEHEVLYSELAELLKRHAGQMTSVEILAVAANMVGKLIALQDQGKITPELALEIVGKNIEVGNQQALAAAEDLKPQGSA